MTPKRKKTEEFIIKYIKALVKGKENVELYENMFKSMTDEDFDVFMNQLKNEEIHLSVVIPNDGVTRITIENNFQVGKQLGHDFFQRVKVTNHSEYPDHMLPNKMLTMLLPIRRAQQLLSKKISVPKHDLTVDQLTGQVAGDSKSSKLSYPEQQLLLAMDMKDTAKEIAKIRGGDQGSSKALNDSLFKTGQATQAKVNEYSTGVTSTKTLKSYLLGMHIKSTL